VFAYTNLASYMDSEKVTIVCFRSKDILSYTDKARACFKRD
jgi:hypothetical protein